MEGKLPERLPGFLGELGEKNRGLEIPFAEIRFWLAPDDDPFDLETFRPQNRVLMDTRQGKLCADLKPPPGRETHPPLGDLQPLLRAELCIRTVIQKQGGAAEGVGAAGLSLKHI